MRHALTALVLCLSGVAVLQPWDAAAQGEASVGESFVQDAQRVGVPAGALARIADGTVVETVTFGDVTWDTPFLWGSVSKPVAARVVRGLVRQGQLDLHDLASSHVDGAPEVTVQQLLDHTAGLPFGAEQLDVDRPTATALDVVAEVHAAGAPASPHSYSSLGYVYVQAVVEAVTRGSYDEALRATFPKTRMAATPAACGPLATAHRFLGSTAVAWPTPRDAAGGAYGYTCGTIGDLAAFAADHLRDPAVGETVPTSRPGEAYGTGWRVSTQKGRQTHWHTGTVPGYFSAVYLDARSGDGVVVLMNVSGYLHEEQLAQLTRLAHERSAGRAPSEGLAGAPLAWVLPLSLVVAAMLALLIGWQWRPQGWRAVVCWGSLLVVVAGCLVLTPMVMGLPARYFLLWEPGLVIGLGLLAAALSVALAISVRRHSTTSARGA